MRYTGKDRRVVTGWKWLMYVIGFRKERRRAILENEKPSKPENLHRPAGVVVPKND